LNRCRVLTSIIAGMQAGLRSRVPAPQSSISDVKAINHKLHQINWPLI